ncbi:hypothetical protein HZH66_012928 [Vespula vulgaris]|uniref:Uncharacterized protein n=1 Tax=Vespula vulgaris TaxID=7454 RepID=A0A834J7Y3_VESVU|nr:hypothetical protein HZH66_012928 [Vespula vulgaris]
MPRIREHCSNRRERSEEEKEEKEEEEEEENAIKLPPNYRAWHTNGGETGLSELHASMCDMGNKGWNNR